MSHFYQSLALKIRRNFYEGKKQQPYALPTVSAKNLKEKFAKLFLTEIQKNLSPKVSSSILPILKKKEKWRKLYKELHFLAKSEMLTQQNFHNKHYADLKEAQKSINLFSPTTRSFILALSWYLKKDNQICLIKNYQYLNWFFKKKNFSMAAMSPLLKIKQVKKNKFYFFHHGLGSLDPIVFQKITSFYLKKNIFLLLLSEKKFIQFCRYTDNYAPREAEGFFLNLKVPLQNIYTKYFSHHSLPPAICWTDSFTCRKLASYNFLKDKISVSPIFDLPQVDPELIEYLLHHEMLHREIGFKIYGNKIYVHTKEFKNKESQIFDLKKIDGKIKNYLNSI